MFCIIESSYVKRRIKHGYKGIKYDRFSISKYYVLVHMDNYILYYGHIDARGLDTLHMDKETNRLD